MNKSLFIVRLRCLERYQEGYATRPDIQADTSWMAFKSVAIIPYDLALDLEIDLGAARQQSCIAARFLEQVGHLQRH